MKRVSLLLLAVLLVLSGCDSGQRTLSLPFEAEDVIAIEVYHYDGVPVEAERKIVTRQEDLLALYDNFNGQKLWTDQLEPMAGGWYYGFRFRLADGRIYELIHLDYGVKKGELFSPADGLRYASRSNNGWWWSNLNYEAMPVSEDTLP